MKRVLITDACQRSALAVTRSLGSKGIPVFTSDETPSSLAGTSRYSAQYTKYASPRQDPKAFIDDIVQLCRKNEIDIIIPMTELTAYLLIPQKEILRKTVLPFPEPSKLNLLVDKCELMRLAESLNIPIPTTWYVDSLDELPISLEKLHYPLVLKPGKSWLKYNGEWIHTSVRFADDFTEAKLILQTDTAFKAHPFLLQSNVPGRGGGVFALYDNGKHRAFFAHKRLREKPPQGGVSVLSQSIPVDPALKKYAKAILDHVGWHGIAMVEFRISDDGTPYLMEINTRFWGSLQLAVDAGVDFPWLLYQVTCGQEVNFNQDYRTDKRLRWLLGDLDSLYLALRGDNFSLSEKFVAILKFMWPSAFRTRHEVNRLSDMGPFWWELKQYFKDLLK